MSANYATRGMRSEHICDHSMSVMYPGCISIDKSQNNAWSRLMYAATYVCCLLGASQKYCY